MSSIRHLRYIICFVQILICRQTVGVSAITGNGIDELFEKLDGTKIEYEKYVIEVNEPLSHIEQGIQAVLKRNHK